MDFVFFPYINGILHGFPALGSKETFHRIKAATDMIYPPLSRTSHSSLLIQTMRCWTAKIQNWWEIWRQKPCFTTAHHGSPRWRTSYSSWKRCARRPLDPVWNTADGWRCPLVNSHITMERSSIFHGKSHYFHSEDRSCFPVLRPKGEVSGQFMSEQRTGMRSAKLGFYGSNTGKQMQCKQ